MTDFVTYSAVVDDVGLSGCKNHRLEVETGHEATKLTKLKINVDRRSSITEVFPVTNCSILKIYF